MANSDLQELAIAFHQRWRQLPDNAILRHAHCAKNAADRRGGDGGHLTDLGQLQAARAASAMKKEKANWTTIVASSATQAVATAVFIRDSLGLPLELDESLDGIDLGFLSGLSEEEMRVRHPADWEIFTQWLRCEIPMSDFELPGKEPGVHFAERILNALHRHISKKPGTLFITGRSPIILCSQVLKSGANFALHTFFNEEWDHCEGLRGTDRVNFGR